MPTIIKEKQISQAGKRSYSNAEITLDLLVYGVLNSTTLEAAIDNYITDTYTVNGRVMFFDGYSYKQEGFTAWTVQVSYKDFPTASDFDITIGGGSTKIQKSIRTVESYDCEGINGSPNFDGAINVTENSIDGVEIPARKMTISISKRMGFSSVPGTYPIELYNLNCTVNDSDFTLYFGNLVLTFVRGTLLFVRGKVKITSEYAVDLSYEFVAERSLLVSDAVEFGASGIITKEGHEYLWFHARDRRDVTTGMTVKKPISGYVEQVFEYSDFSTIIL